MERQEPGNRRPGWLVIAWIAACALLLVSAWPTFESVVDDAFIAARYSQHYAEGFGLVYNAGEPPVEGYTDLAWVIVVGWGLWAGVDPHMLMVWLGVLFGFATLGFATLLTARLLGDRAWPAAALPGFLIASDAHFAVSTTNGLESSMFSAGVVGAAWASLAAEGRWRWPAGVANGLLWTIRPEGAAASALLAVHDVIRRRESITRAEGWAIAGPTVAMWGLTTVWRLATYGMWLPNTWYAKASFPIVETFKRNGPYLSPETAFFVALGVGAVVGTLSPPWKLERFAIGALAVGMGLIPLSVSLWMPGLRLFLPTIALAACLAALPVGSLRRGPAFAWALVVMAGAGWLAYEDGTRVRRYDGHHTVLMNNGASLAAKHIAANVPDGTWISTRDAGVVAYYVGTGVLVAETHNRALTQPHPDGKDAQVRSFTPENPGVQVTTVRTAEQTEFTYGVDRMLLQRSSVPYVYMGRVNQHFRRHYDFYARADLDLPPFEDGVVVSWAGPAAPIATPDSPGRPFDDAEVPSSRRKGR